MQPNFIQAINIIAEEKNLPHEIVLETVEAALAAAYKKDYGDKDQEVRVALDEKSGATHVFVTKEVAKTPENDFLQMTLEDAKKIKPKAKVGDMVEYEDHPEDFGRVAAQTAKQVIIQRLREAEREIVFAEYKDKEDTILNGTVQRIEGNTTFVDLGKATGVLFPSEQIPGERYYPGHRIKVYVVRVEQTNRGPQIVLSRAHANMVKLLFELEVPEIETGAVEIKALAREAGVRTKVAVISNAEGVDPVGTFVGGRGSRVQTVMGELGEEKIDIIPYSEDPATFIASALSPTKVISVDLDEAEKKAIVRVPEDQLSLAIGKQGQNVRLAAKLSGWNIDIVSADESRIEATADAAAADATKASPKDLEGALIEAVNQTGEPEPADEAPVEAAAEPETETDEPTPESATD
ncbi:MAG TPA: transcription termination factor NusA [Candidatus Saccharimonadales bacterium]|nr:transcription termination factor NusA [Candidatus Saccharimonadales bacterium]